MSNFKREERYIVVKLIDLLESGKQERDLRCFLGGKAIPTRACVVVEPDWPIYEETWENVQRLAEGRPSIRDEWDALARQCDALEKRLEVAERNNNSLARLVFQAMEWNWMDKDAPDASEWEEAVNSYSPLKDSSHE